MTLAIAPLQARPEALMAIIIDDLGDRHEAGRRAVDLPGALTYAILPHTPYSRRLAERAHAQGKEVMLHLPMQAIDPNKRLGKGALTLAMGEQALRHTLHRALAAVPHASGINNHMGSLLTSRPEHMAWLMRGLRGQDEGLYFVDSYTSHESIARQQAREHLIPTARRDVFLDTDPQPAAIARQFERLLHIARRKGAAVGIAHPYPSTLQFLEQQLAQQAFTGVRLVAVSELIQRQAHGSPEQWQASLSPSPKAVKNSKRSPSSTCCAAPASRW